MPVISMETVLDPGGDTDVMLYVVLSLIGLCLECMAVTKLYQWSVNWYQRRFVRMKKRVTYRPSKANSAIGAIWGGVFVLIGLFVVIPTFGAFGLLWTLGAAVITGMNVYQGFGKHYVGPEICVEDEEPGPERAAPPPAQTHDHIPSTAPDARRRLEQLESLKNAGLIDDREYREKRQEILKEL